MTKVEGVPESNQEVRDQHAPKAVGIKKKGRKRKSSQVNLPCQGCAKRRRRVELLENILAKMQPLKHLLMID